MELFILEGGIYARRVQIYLAEKGIIPDGNDTRPLKITPCTTKGTHLVAPGKPPGSVPILSLGDGHFIKQSLSIIEYFEDLCDDIQQRSSLLETASVEDKALYELITKANPSMRGITLAERARNRDIIHLADEAYTHFGVACHKGSALNALLEEQSPVTARMAMTACRRILTLVEEYYVTDDRFANAGVTENADPVFNVADCVLFTLLQFARVVYDVDLTDGLPRMSLLYKKFEGRKSVKLEGIMCDKDVKYLARQWNSEPKPRGIATTASRTYNTLAAYTRLGSRMIFSREKNSVE